MKSTQGFVFAVNYINDGINGGAFFLLIIFWRVIMNEFIITLLVAGNWRYFGGGLRLLLILI
jgi:hypothetical protein